MPPSGNFQDLNSAFNFLMNLGSESTGPRFKGFNRQSIRQMEVVERLIPLNTLYFFLDFTFEGRLPSGAKTTQPLVREEEVSLFGKPYAEWALAPWNQTSSSLQDRILNTPERFHAQVACRVACMRARLWEGLVPMSGARWKEKGLDEPRNWQFTFEFLHEIFQVFMWMGDPHIQRGIKESFNLIAKEMQTFQGALNARREQMGVQDRVDMTKLWLEFVKSVFETMVTRTHGWFLARVDESVAKYKAEYDADADLRGASNCYDVAKKFGECWSDLNRLLSMADFALMMPLDDFAGFSASPSDSKVVGSLFPLPFRRDQQKEIEAELAWPVMERLAEDIPSIYTNREKLEAMLGESAQNKTEMRHRMRGEPRKLASEHWISIIQSRTAWSLGHGGPQDQRWGFVAYKLTHGPSEAEWNAFREKLYAEFAKAGEWVEGFDEVKPNMELQWIDAKACGIPHDDINAARRHFQMFSKSAEIRVRAWKTDFFVVDSECFTSYMAPTPQPSTPPPVPTSSNPSTWALPIPNPTLADTPLRKSHGDHGGYLRLIDGTAYDPVFLSGTAPGYRNELKVLGSLVFDDLYPQLASMARRPKDLWCYAMWHPNQVYVGPTVESQEKEWEEVWKAREVFWRAFEGWRQREEGRANV